MEEVKAILNNPIIKNGLRIAAPEIALGVEIISGLFSSKRTTSAEQLLAVIDKELARVLETLATTESKNHRRECEIRAHTILGLLNEWEKIT